jgi:nitrate reductase gamma subunit
MRDHLLFAVLPYVGALSFAAGCVIQMVRRRRAGRREMPAAIRGAFRLAFVAALAALALGHLLTLGFPDAVLRWDQGFVRLLLLEGTQIVAGGIVVAGALAGLARLLHPPEGGSRSTIDLVVATLLLVAMTSGLALALLYRWASAWSTVTLAPYLFSLAHLHPSTELVTDLPPVVKLHVLSAFIVVAVLPFTRRHAQA